VHKLLLCTAGDAGGRWLGLATCSCARVYLNQAGGRRILESVRARLLGVRGGDMPCVCRVGHLCAWLLLGQGRALQGTAEGVIPGAGLELNNNHVPIQGACWICWGGWCFVVLAEAA
jgi:hypothetical protein